MKRKLFTVLALILAFCSLSVAAYATDLEPEDNNANETVIETIYYEDGSYAEVSVSEEADATAPLATTSIKTASKTYTYYNSKGTARWYYKLTGTFTYNGSTSRATKVAVNYASYTSSWTLKSESHSISGKTVSGSATYKTATREKTANLSISCSKNGTIS